MVDPVTGHYLRPNAENERPTHHLFFDIESTVTPGPGGESTHKLRLGWAGYWHCRYDGRPAEVVYTQFDTEGAIWDIVDTRCYPHNTLVLVAHNIGYDFGVLHGFAHLEDRGFKLTRVYLKGLSNLLTFKAPGRTLKLIDNGCWFHGSLAALGNAIGLPKLDVDYRTDDLALLSTYCHRDVEIMVRAWQQLYAFLDKHNLGNWSPTVAGQAFNAFRHRFMHDKILIKQTPDTVALERASYHGGRSTCFRVGDFAGETLHKVDVNSMYPYVMHKFPCPYQPVGAPMTSSVSGLEKLLAQYAVIADVQVTTTEPVFPVKHANKNVYPVGTFRTTLTTPELSYALSQGWVHQVYALQRYKQTILFRDYVDFFYALKAQYTTEGNAPFRFLVKLYLNALYGKFGQRNTEWSELHDVPPELAESQKIYDTVTGRSVVLYHLGESYWTEQDKGEGHNAFPAISAHITAQARMYLWSLILTAGREQVYYCDTDSLIVTQQGLENLSGILDALRLGALKLEDTCNDAIIHAPKLYHFSSHWTRKGISANAIELSPNTFQMTQFPSIRGLATKPEQGLYTTTEVTKRLNLGISDGTLTTEGWVIPFPAERLDSTQQHSPDDQLAIDYIQLRISTLASVQALPQKLLRELWDFRRETWKRQRDRQGRLVPGEYARIDDLATENGYRDTDAFERAVRAQIESTSLLHSLEIELRTLTS